MTTREEKTVGAIITDFNPRCPVINGKGYICGRLLAPHVSRPWKLVCSKCGKPWTDEEWRDVIFSTEKVKRK